MFYELLDTLGEPLWLLFACNDMRQYGSFPVLSLSSAQ